MTAIAIIGAMDEEVAHIAAALDDVAVTDEAGLTITRGTLTTDRGAECDIIATVGGMGMVNIAATTQHLIDVGHPDAVIFSGIAGNLNPSLHVNDVVLGGTLRYLDTDMRLVGQWKPGTADAPVQEFHSDERLIAFADQALTDLGITHIVGIIATGNISSTIRPRSSRSCVRPAPTRSKWRVPPWRMWPPVTTCLHWSSVRCPTTPTRTMRNSRPSTSPNTPTLRRGLR